MGSFMRCCLIMIIMIEMITPPSPIAITLTKQNSLSSTWHQFFPESSLYKFGSCLIDCLVDCPSRFFNGSWLNQMTLDLHRTFTKWKVWSPELFQIVQASARACVHAQRMKSCTLFLPTFLVSCFYFLKPFLSENEKTEAALKIGMAKAQLFNFIIFFPF